MERVGGHMGLYLLSFLLIHKYFKAFLTHKAEKKQRNRKRERESVGKSSRAGRRTTEMGKTGREKEEPLSMNISKL